MWWIAGYFAAGTVMAGFMKCEDPLSFCACVTLWPLVALFTLGATIGSYFK